MEDSISEIPAPSGPDYSDQEPPPTDAEDRWATEEEDPPSCLSSSFSLSEDAGGADDEEKYREPSPVTPATTGNSEQPPVIFDFGSTAVNRGLSQPTRLAALLELNRAAAEGSDAPLVVAALPGLLEACADDSDLTEGPARFMVLSFCLIALAPQTIDPNSPPVILPPKLMYSFARQLQIWKRLGFAAYVPHIAAEDMHPQELRAGCALLVTRFVVKFCNLQHPSAVEICEACLTCSQSPDVQAAGIQAVSALVLKVQTAQPLGHLQRLLNALDSCYRSSAQIGIRHRAAHVYGDIQQVSYDPHL